MSETFNDEVFAPTQPMREWLEKPSSAPADNRPVKRTRWPQAGRRPPPVASRRDQEVSPWAAVHCLMAALASAGMCCFMLVLGTPAFGDGNAFWRWVVAILIVHAVSLVASIYMVLLGRGQAAPMVAGAPVILGAVLAVSVGAVVGMALEFWDTVSRWIG